MAYEMYQEQILDHYKHPRNYGDMPDADLQATDNNPLCGDQLTIFLKVGDDRKIADVKFNGIGCAISRASASLLTMRLKGKTVEEARKIDKEDVLKALGIPLGPVRLKCALLSLQVLKKALFSKEMAESIGDTTAG